MWTQQGVEGGTPTQPPELPTLIMQMSNMMQNIDMIPETNSSKSKTTKTGEPKNEI